MTRRSDHSREEIKALAIKYAYELIEEKGEAGFKARNIAKRMGYTVGTIYYVFGSMGSLRFHVCAHILDYFHEITLKGLSRRRNKLDYHVSRYIKFSEEYFNLWTFLHSVNNLTKGEAPKFYEEKIHRFFNLLTEALIPYSKSKKMALKAARTIVPSLHGMCLYSQRRNLIDKNPSNLEAMAIHMVKTYLKGLNHS